MSKINDLLCVSEKEKFKVRQLYGKTEESIEEDLKMIKEWIMKEPHLPQNDKDIRLENILLRNKFRIERTKEKLDKYYSYRGLYPDFFQTYDVNSQKLKTFMKGQMYTPMPKLTDKQERILVYKIVDPNPDLFNFHDLASYILMMLDICTSHDYCVGERIIKDWSGMSMSHVRKLEPTTIYKLLKLHQEAFSSRIISFEYVNCPPFMDLILQLFKPIFKEKIFGRIVIHKDLDSLHRNISKEFLPKELGGTQESLLDLHEQWKQELSYHQTFLEENAKLISNEKLRIGKLEDNDLFGTEGSFKKLNID